MRVGADSEDHTTVNESVDVSTHVAVIYSYKLIRMCFRLSMPLSQRIQPLHLILKRPSC